jgi:hypothetical protein
MHHRRMVRIPMPEHVRFFKASIGCFLLGALASLAWLGYSHAPWWQPVLAALVVLGGRELLTGGQIIHMGMRFGLSFLIKAKLVGAFLCAIPWSIGYAASLMF